MDTNEHESKLIHGEFVDAIVGCAIEVLNELGHGLNEKPYENALTVEFGFKGIAYDQQARFDVTYKGRSVGEYIPDLIAAKAVVVDAKAIDRITEIERGQMINYLRITRLRVGGDLELQETQTRVGAYRAPS